MLASILRKKPEANLIGLGHAFHIATALHQDLSKIHLIDEKAYRKPPHPDKIMKWLTQTMAQEQKYKKRLIQERIRRAKISGPGEGRRLFREHKPK